MASSVENTLSLISALTETISNRVVNTHLMPLPMPRSNMPESTIAKLDMVEITNNPNTEMIHEMERSENKEARYARHLSQRWFHLIRIC